ncbi:MULTISPECIES: MAPEG family protein [Pseudomonas]|jgi:uncharacterized MAPEG superfamily protein|uniref:Microsomal glutathione S-transferase 1 n=1 Tax=Pseudomonas soli TaxID=1306993 RepID=A0A2V4HEY3_9PSED|nr:MULTISPECIES: MAPEG family protein [Pseudomonas]PYB76188.1 glutathione metabolism protein [Pseudomonas soli]PZW74786.1 MAPEG family protein [Pseudomonas sp. 2848]QWA27013.1 MAPEG family protein [Pseudomonas sp. RC3H12]
MSGALAAFAGCVVVLCCKMLAISCYQGYHRLRHLAFINPEDAAVFGRSAQPADLPAVTRAMQAWRNDLENIPMFIALAGLAVALQAPVTLTLWLSGVFTAARVLHTVTYLAGIQPWRTVSYGLGVLCLVGLAGLVVQRVLVAQLPG